MSKFNMKNHEVDAAAERRKKMIKAMGLSSIAVLVLAAGGLLAWYFTPPDLPTTMDEAIAVANSPRYKRLSDKQKQPYLDVIREQFGSLDRGQRRAMLGDDQDARDMARDAMRAMMMKRMKAFGAATYEQRQAMLAQMPQRPRGAEGRGGHEGRGGPGGAGGRGGGDPGQMSNRMSNRMANGNAQVMGTIGVWVRQRRAQQNH